MSRKIFGTDGIRSLANEFPMTPDTILRVGQALGLLIRRSSNGSLKVVIGKDTRISGYMVEQALTCGLNSMGVSVQLVGPLPSPAIGFLARNMRADAGVMISASHNPYWDNGIKIFASDGFKISNSMEKEIEKLVLDTDLSPLLCQREHLGRTRRIEDATGRYIVHIKNSFPLELSLEGLHIVLDCAHGATYKVAPSVFSELGAQVTVLGNSPNGFNVNHKSGALHPGHMCEKVVELGAHVGVSLDGDGDRVIMSDENGVCVDGDHILAVVGSYFKSKGFLKKNTVVATEMSNLGLESFMDQRGIQVLRTQVGDKNVVQAMRQGGYVLGGESSGHIIFLEHSTTGDGCVGALNVLAAMKNSGKKLSELTSGFERIPQFLVNKKVKQKPPLDSIEGFLNLKEKVESQLTHPGRILVRYSGTEDIVRVLVEGPNPQQAQQWANEVGHFLEKNLNP